MKKPERRDEGGGVYSPETALGLTLRRIRRERGLTQAQLADETGYHRNFIGLVERGERSLSIRTLYNLAVVLGVRPSSMLASGEKLLNLKPKKRNEQT